MGLKSKKSSNIGLSLRYKFALVLLLSLSAGPTLAQLAKGYIMEHSMGLNPVIISAITNIIISMIVIQALTEFMIIRPIKQMIKLVKNIGRDELKEEDLKFQRSGEIGYLQRELGNMILDMNKMLKEINYTTTEVSQVSKELSVSTRQADEMAIRSAEAIGEVASSAEQNVNLIQGLSDNIQRINGNITDNNQISIRDISKAANEGNEIISRAVEVMEEIDLSINNSATTVDKLNSFTQEISNFVGAITNIAEQTNLLALNASIEAARAGEHGKGFAVVAEEIRQLAEESNKSAEDIVDLIKQMKRQSEDTVKEMEVGREKADTGLDIINQANKEFITIKDKVNELDMALDKAVSSSEDIASFVEEISASAEEVAAISQEQSVEAEKSSETVGKLEAVVADLEKLVEEINLSKE
ncbi:methyl-accepting chemotaxis protein [Orenia metallireducens]|uniref:Methyl-accepting chemotaxis protein n=1 Tax=Orenia metallireducens TaxID=1413210 RepID=A0A285GZ04_9FIRM|nr:methyl-accepting chemotaxis protein [Orenia metallireducens]PRX26453.1 methyl-accepting chemotaxis protein [Orenia metallireducens]SNY28727.1 methyl-accepting chemotaxis protein [Orenia metallireducens]